MKKLLKRSFVVLIFAFIVAQFVSPARTNPPVDPAREIAAIHPPGPEVGSLLQKSCNDCHSNRTVWPWYSHVAPASWIVTHDVNEGREALNLSEWAGYNAETTQKLLGKICEEVRDREMPVAQYTFLHPGARLSSSDVEAICSWTGKVTAQSTTASQEEDDD